MITATSTENAKIKIRNSDIELSEVLIFVDFSTIGGKKIQVPLKVYEGQTGFDAKKPIKMVKKEGKRGKRLR